MKKKYCINIGECFALSLVLPIGWSFFLSFMFLLSFFVALGKDEVSAYFDTIANGYAIWLYISAPISFVIFASIGLLSVVFPFNYVEIGERSIMIHHIFKKDRIIFYNQILSIRFDKNFEKKWLFILPMMYLSYLDLAGPESFYTTEIYTECPLPNFMLFSSHRAYKAMAEKFKTNNSSNGKIIEGENFVAKDQWFNERINMQDLDWINQYKN